MRVTVVLVIMLHVSISKEVNRELVFPVERITSCIMLPVYLFNRSFGDLNGKMFYCTCMSGILAASSEKCRLSGLGLC